MKKKTCSFFFQTMTGYLKTNKKMKGMQYQQSIQNTIGLQAPRSGRRSFSLLLTAADNLSKFSDFIEIKRRLTIGLRRVKLFTSSQLCKFLAFSERAAACRVNFGSQTLLGAC